MTSSIRAVRLYPSMDPPAEDAGFSGNSPPWLIEQLFTGNRAYARLHVLVVSKKGEPLYSDWILGKSGSGVGLGGFTPNYNPEDVLRLSKEATDDAIGTAIKHFAGKD